MADPVTLTVLGSWAAAEGIKFLYGQAAELLKAWRESRTQADSSSSKLVVPIVGTGVLDQDPSSPLADLVVLGTERESLATLAAALSNYAQGLADIDENDAVLAQQAGDLRAILEAIYGQRFTFRGERREPTGTQVTVTQVFGDVSGTVVGAEADVTAGDLNVNQDATTIRPGGTVTGFKGTIGR